MTTGLIHDQNLEKQIEKQMGCMAGFLQIFDRHQILNGKRIYTAKRIPYPVSDSASERSMDSPAYSTELRPSQQKEKTKQSDMRSLPVTPESLRSPAPEVPAKTPTHLPVFEFKEGFRSSWKFKEAPRLSLDSRAVVDGKGKLYPKENRTNAAAILSGRSKNGEENEKQKRSPSVIAKLMGLEALPESGREPLQKAELRRSASESRVSRDLQFVDGNGHGDGNSFQIKYQKQQSFAGNFSSNFARDNAVKGRTLDLKGFGISKPNTESQKGSRGGFGFPGVANASSWKPQQQQQQQRKSYFDAQDVFPEPRQTETLYGEIEKRLKMRGIDEPAKDLETLKQILEALQLKGLLHSNRRAAEQIRNRNIITDSNFSYEESPIVLMKPARSNASIGRTGTDISPNLRSKPAQPIRLRRDGPEMNRNLQNQRFGKQQNESSDKSPSSVSRRRANDCVQRRKTFSSNSPKTPATTTSRSPRSRRSTGEISSKERAEDELSTVSESSKSTSSQIDTERSKMEEYKEGKSLLARCDKLLDSIAEITASNELQPSPVSVLDSSFYKDDSSPSPVMKRCIDYKEQYEELNGDNWNPFISPFRLKFDDQSEDYDFLYISEILRATDCASENTDVFLLIEKHQTRSNSSETFRLHRKLVFDTITEILQKMKDLPPWKAFSGANSFVGKPSLKQIWLEFRRIRERESVAEDLFDVIFGVLRKDMAGDGVNGWRDFQMQTSEAVLDIERLIFKDLVVETIKDLATFSGKNRSYISRRKLVF